MSDCPGSEIKVTKDWEGEKLVMVIACQSGKPHFIIAVILKNKNEAMEAVKDLLH